MLKCLCLLILDVFSDLYSIKQKRMVLHPQTARNACHFRKRRIQTSNRTKGVGLMNVYVNNKPNLEDSTPVNPENPSEFPYLSMIVEEIGLIGVG